MNNILIEFSETPNKNGRVYTSESFSGIEFPLRVPILLHGVHDDGVAIGSVDLSNVIGECTLKMYDDCIMVHESNFIDYSEGSIKRLVVDMITSGDLKLVLGGIGNVDDSGLVKLDKISFVFPTTKPA